MQIWDIKTNALISTFVRSYVATGLALAWSPFNSDLILIGDKALSIWSIEKNPPLNDKGISIFFLINFNLLNFSIVVTATGFSEKTGSKMHNTSRREGNNN